MEFYEDVQSYERDFKGIWIPKQIWLDKRLSALDKIILAEIDSLDCGERGCYASNRALSEFCQCSEAKITKSISKLISLGYLYIQSFDGRQRQIRSRLVENTKQTRKKYEADSQKIQEINIDNNIFNNINNNSSLSTKVSKEDNVELARLSEEVIAYLNEKAGRHFRLTYSNLKFIQARMRESKTNPYTIEDFKKVIDKKCAEWKGTDMAGYLRPQTLFGEKFDSYLNNDCKRKVSNCKRTNEIEESDPYADRQFGIVL